MSDAAVHQLTPGYNFNGRYYVSRCIGAGGMGAVYEAVHGETHGKVALKVMLPRLVHRADARQRFLQEARVTAKVQSNHIVQVFDAGVDDATGMPFIVMELLVGQDLDAMLARAGRLPPHVVITLLRQAALALDKTHAAGVVHRDLKPHNLFVSQRDDGSPSVKILDFGIAKLIDTSGAGDRTRSAGTPLYMPPEQMRGEGDIDAAADVYALAHIAYTALVGRPYWETEATELGLGPFVERIFAGPTQSAVARAQIAGVQLPAAFDVWFAQATAPNKAARIMPASQAIASLAAALGHADADGAPVVFPQTSGASVSHPAAMSPFASGAAQPMTPATLGTMGAVVTQPPRGAGRGRTKPLWFLVGAAVVLASVALGSLITYRLVLSDRVEHAERDDEDTDERKKSKKKKKKEPAPCAFERCKDIELSYDKPVEVLDWIQPATKLARSLEPDVELVMISVGETSNGKSLRDASFSMVFIYRYPKPAGNLGEFSGMQVIVNHEQMLARRSSDVGLAPVAAPRCSTQRALRTAFAAGIDAQRRSTVTYQLTAGASAPHWMIAQTGDVTAVRYVDGITCASFSPY